MKKLESLIATVDVLGTASVAVSRAVRYCGSPAWCDFHWQQDRVQDALLKFGRALERCDWDSPLALLSKIAHDEVVSAIRRTREYQYEEAVEVTTRADATELIIAEETRHRIGNLQSSLRESDWKILRYCLQTGQSMGVRDGEGAAIMENFGLSGSALRSVRKRILDSYADLVEREEERCFFEGKAAAFLRHVDPRSALDFVRGLPENWKAEGHVRAGKGLYNFLQHAPPRYQSSQHKTFLRSWLEANRWHFSQAKRLASQAGQAYVTARANFCLGSDQLYFVNLFSEDLTARIAVIRDGLSLISESVAGFLDARRERGAEDAVLCVYCYSENLSKRASRYSKVASGPIAKFMKEASRQFRRRRYVPVVQLVRDLLKI